MIGEHHIIPNNATIRQEYVKCSNLDCKELHKPHGPYLYAYWKDKENKKLRKKYIGRTWDDWANRMCSNGQADMPPSNIRKHKFLEKEREKGNNVAKEYFQKYAENKVSIGWAYKVVVNRIKERRLFTMVMLARKYNFEYDEPTELVGFVGDKMRSKGLDPMNIEAMDSYLNSEFR